MRLAHKKLQTNKREIILLFLQLAVVLSATAINFAGKFDSTRVAHVVFMIGIVFGCIALVILIYYIYVLLKPYK